MSNAEEAAVACAILGQAACIAYIGSRCFQADFKILFAIIMCISLWKNCIGITIAAAYILHQVFKKIQARTEKGQVLGFPAANPVAAAAAAADCRAEEQVKKEEEQEEEQKDLLCKESSKLADEDEKEGKNTEVPNCIDVDVDVADTTPHTNTRNKKKIQKSQVARISQRLTREARRVRNLSNRQQQQQRQDEIRKQPLQSQPDHPGLHAFHQWMGAISDIYRMYSIGKVDEDESTVPLLPRSERGHVPLHMKVQNRTVTDIDVFWIDFKGNEVPKGSMKKFNGNINITTWIGHPWAFRAKDSGRLMLYYVPYRIIPVIDAQKDNFNGDDDGDETGVHSFSIVTTKNIQDMCAVEDDLFPYPAKSISNINKALGFSIQQMEREQVSPHMILQYLYNIALHPSDSKYRQIRVANKVFWNSVWCNGGRGVLHALGFEEHGPYIDMGPDSSSLPGDRVKDVSNAIVMLEEFMKDVEDVSKSLVRQPRGADGSGTGRANWRM
mmetsp:Transcript_14126/g.21184  ORF Transcript_14126/g.21184 Transcript_14126/m.21184 type:complete len:498 (+) Transcript_14126:110-1603(+)